MVSSRIKGNILALSAIVGSAVYCILTYVSITIFPGPFGPLDNYLSQLGNSSLNPEGAIFYNLAVIITGMCLIPFYGGLYHSYRNPNGNKRLMSVVLFGMINALSIMMSGVFSEDFYAQHFFWSLMIFVTWIPVLFITNVVLMKQGGIVKWNSVYGIGLGFFDTSFVGYVLLFGTSSGAIIEWVTIFSFILWAIILAVGTIKKDRV
ncbi:MAG: DUF998 domain-containing protein [Candidatus Thorarchaeota archaeon]|jgi:hypothetical protein